MAPAEPLSGPAAVLRVEVAWSAGPRDVRRVMVALPQGATVGDAILASALGEHLCEAGGGWRWGIWGRKADPGTPVRDADRVEIYQPFRVDPKDARRVRYRAHGEKLPKGVHRPKDRVPDMTRAPGSD